MEHFIVASVHALEGNEITILLSQELQDIFRKHSKRMAAPQIDCPSVILCTFIKAVLIIKHICYTVFYSSQYFRHGQVAFITTV